MGGLRPIGFLGVTESALSREELMRALIFGCLAGRGGNEVSREDAAYLGARVGVRQ